VPRSGCWNSATSLVSAPICHCLAALRLASKL
jgi:hypothetical protein